MYSPQEKRRKSVKQRFSPSGFAYKSGIAYGTRTRVARVKGGSPGPLDERDMETCTKCGRSKHDRLSKIKHYFEFDQKNVLFLF